jgi:PQQ-like domain
MKKVFNLNLVSPARLFVPATFLALTCLAAASRADLAPEWVSRVPLGSSLSSAPAGIYVDPDGVSYVTGTSGTSNGTDITTVSFAPDGTTRWSQTWSGPNGGDQARGITKGPNGVLYVVGNTLNQNAFANVLVLAYDAQTGTLLKTIRYSTDAFTSEIGATIAIDNANNIYVGGTTNGDATDVMTLKFNSDGVLQWRQAWDGPAFGPFSNDGVIKLLLDSVGNPLVLINGLMASNHPDYVVVKYAAATGATLWEANWGVSGEDLPTDMELDAADDVYVTGIGIDLIDKYSTIKLNGANGDLIWQFYDALGNDHSASGLFLDGKGGVLITGASDPEGNHSNFNDDFFTVKRDASTGAQLWTHVYGDPCVGCYDVPTDVRVDSQGHVFVVGFTSSPPYSNDVILFVLDNNTGEEIDRGLVFSSGAEVFNSGALRFDAAFNLYDGGRVYNADTGAVDMSVTKWASLVGNGGIPCSDIASFQARCRSTSFGDRLQVRLTLTDMNHAGENVTVTVDGAPFVLDIVGSRAQLSIPGTPGSHTIELTDPAGCVAPIVPVCGGD